MTDGLCILFFRFYIRTGRGISGIRLCGFREIEQIFLLKEVVPANDFTDVRNINSVFIIIGYDFLKIFL